MRFSTTLLVVLCSFLVLVVAGCGADTGPAKSTTGSELSQFLEANPDVANEEEEEEDEDDGEGDE